MQTVLIEITNSKALRLLCELEGLHLIRFLKNKEAANGQKLSDRFAGKLNLSDKEYEDFQQYLQDVRNEWAVKL